MPFSVYNEKHKDGCDLHSQGEKIKKRRPAVFCLSQLMTLSFE